MIAAIELGSTAEGFIRYNEKKIWTEKATLIHNTTMEEKTDSKISVMKETADLNPTVKKNKAAHIFISLPKGEHISDSAFIDLAQDYLKGMGFDNSPQLIYRHFDRGHDHIHIVVPTVNLEGDYNKSLNGFYKKESQKLSRGLEISHGLERNVEKGADNSKKLNEINAVKYKMSKAILKAYNNPEFREKVLSFNGTSDFIESVRKEPDVTNNYVEKFYREKGFKNDYKELSNFLYSNGLVYKTNKEELVEKLDAVYEKSTSKEDFFLKLEANNIYYANINSGYKYGLGDKSFYVNEKNLPKKYSVEGLNYFGEVVADKKEQIGYIYNSINKALPKSTDLEMFIENMRLNKIEVKLDRNSGGIYGISFRSEAVANSTFIKGSDIHKSMSWNNISQNLKINETKTPEFKQKQNNLDLKAPAAGKAASTPNTKKMENEIGKNSDAEAARIRKQLKKLDPDKGDDLSM